METHGHQEGKAPSVVPNEPTRWSHTDVVISSYSSGLHILGASSKIKRVGIASQAVGDKNGLDDVAVR